MRMLYKYVEQWVGCLWRVLLKLNCDDMSLSNTTDGVEIILIHENMHQISRESKAEELNEYMNDIGVWFVAHKSTPA